MTIKTDWLCTSCSWRFPEQFTQCPKCRKNGGVVYAPEKEKALPTLGIHVSEGLGAKSTLR